MNSEIIKKRVPYKQRQLLVNVVKRGYADADYFIEHEPMFKWRNDDKYIRGYIKVWAIENRMKLLADEGLLNFVCTNENNSIKNCKHIELRNRNTTITLNSTKSRFEVPRVSKFREKLRYNTQISLFDNDSSINNGDVYIMLTHGGNITPEYINLGISSPNMKTWVERIDILSENQLYEISEEEKIIDEKVKIALKRKFTQKEDAQ